MTISGTPSRAISTACACLSWCGAKRRRTPAAAAVRRSSARAAAGDQVASACSAVDDAQQWADRELAPDVDPGLELFPSPCVHADLATAPALAASDQQRAAAVIEIALGQSESLLDTEPGSPHDHDQCAQAPTVPIVARAAHDCDDLLDLGRVGRVAQTLVSRRVAGLESRQRRRRSTSTGAVEQKLGH
jgi:hypothetical protein